MVFNSDACAASGIGNRVGQGKVRHIEVTQLRLQDRVSHKVFVLHKVGTDDNLADALTKGVDAASILQHLEGVGIELRSGRHLIAPELENEDNGACRTQDAPNKIESLTSIGTT